MLRVIGVLVVIALTIAALVECVQTRTPRLMPRFVWAVVIIALPVIGPLAWFLLGRVGGLGGRSGTRRVVAPDDDSTFLRELDDEAWQIGRAHV